MDALKLILFLCAFFVCTSAYSVDYVNHTYVTAETTAGTIRGMRTLQTDGKYLDVYLGVPFADPPLGNLRFAAPKNPTPWGGVLDCFTFKRQCPQRNSPLSDEDCLYMNIYTPFANHNPSTLLPVMVWIHGGCFTSGNAEGYDGSLLAQKDVIIVTISYRLCSLGFLSTDDPVAAGNWGLLDNIIALEWIQSNIQNFGGNPNNVTAFGQSSGGVSASLLLFSPLAQGILHGVIAMSGTATAPWAIFRPPYEASNATRQLAQSLGCPTATSQQMIDCLRAQTWQDLVNTVVQYPQDWCEWTPNVDGYFILDDPTDLLWTGDFLKVPFIVGETRDELPYPPVTLSRQQFESDIDDWLNAALYLQTGNKDALFDSIVYEYTEYSDPDNEREIRDEWVEFKTDHFYVSPSDYHGKWHAKQYPGSYKYNFQYMSPYKSSPDHMGITHSTDLSFLFGTPFLHENRTCPWDCSAGNWYDSQSDWTDTDREVSELVMTLYTNLAMYGDPTPTPVSGIIWEEFDDVDDAYLEFSATSAVKYDYRAREMLYWQDYFRKVMYRGATNATVSPPVVGAGECQAAGATLPDSIGILMLVIAFLATFQTLY